MGSCSTEREAQDKLSRLQNSHNVAQEVVHFELFKESLPSVVFSKKRERTALGRTNTIDDREISKSKAKKLESEEELHVIAKVQGVLKDRAVSLWDALISTNLNITENTKVPVRELKLMLKSLDLGLSLKEKLILTRIADPEGTGKCDIQTFVSRFEKDGAMSKRGVMLILEKLSTSLF